MRIVFLFGVIGFAGFEGLRIYKCLWAGHPILPLNHKHFYFVVLAIVACFSGAIATAFSPSNAGEAIYIGFSVPTGIKALLDRPGGSGRKRKATRPADQVDDISVRSPRFTEYVMNHYFRFR
jgi:hypothetical protein